MQQNCKYPALYVMLEHMTDSANNAPYSMIGVEIPVHHALY